MPCDTVLSMATYVSVVLAKESSVSVDTMVNYQQKKYQLCKKQTDFYRFLPTAIIEVNTIQDFCATLNPTCWDFQPTN